MASEKDSSDVVELIKNSIANLSIGESLTALQISKDLGINKSTINKHLYKLSKDGDVKMVKDIPPRWSKNETRCEATGGIGVFNDIIPKSKLENWKGKNPIIVINEYCQYTMRDWSIIVKYDENSTYPLFLANVIISDKEFSVMKGRSKKEAKNNAATVAVDAILNKENVEDDDSSEVYEEVTKVCENTSSAETDNND
ncbi:protein E3 [BeAn 58058 virus]|uniref:protein E3 n=1 Tax=BeAn 58058 virus TaxID=67082 RepID=UPI00090B262B|nr:protein E3 [BeAn 58058 virus]APG58244.1 protein E3 [BeAn 58058 virus]